MYAVADLHGLPEEDVLRTVTSGPAAEFGLAEKGRLAPGMDADLVLVDATATHIVDEELLPSKSKWSPYHGRMIRGLPQMVWLRGALAWSREMPVDVPRGRPLFPRPA